MSPTKVEISTLPDGRGAVWIDGVDLSKHVSGFRVDCRAGEGATITLHLRARTSLDLAAMEPAVTLIRRMLVEQGDCSCTELLPELGRHGGGLAIDEDCPQHGVRVGL